MNNTKDLIYRKVFASSTPACCYQINTGSTDKEFKTVDRDTEMITHCLRHYRVDMGFVRSN